VRQSQKRKNLGRTYLSVLKKTGSLTPEDNLGEELAGVKKKVLL
jgi:hypothetical protein